MADDARWKQLDDSIDALVGAADVAQVANRYKNPHSNIPYDDPQFASRARHEVETQLGTLLERWPLDAGLSDAVDRVATRLRTFQGHYSWHDRLLAGDDDPRLRLVRRFELGHDEYDAERIGTLVARAAPQMGELFIDEGEFPGGLHALFEGVDYPALWRLAIDDLEAVDPDDRTRTIEAIIGASWLSTVEDLSIGSLADSELARLIANPAFRPLTLAIGASFGDESAAALAAHPWTVEHFTFNGVLTWSALTTLCAQASLRRVELGTSQVPALTRAELAALGAPSLRELTLATVLCGESEATLASLATLPMLGSLERLEIRLSDSTYDSDLEHLARVPMPRLTHLRLYGRYITDRGRAALCAAFPACVVEITE